MKALLVIESDKATHEFVSQLTFEGCECIRYRQPLKAMDNLEEIDPQLLIISATDFPRHWKPFVQFAQNTLLAKLPVCLINREKMDADEEKKAEYLGIKAVFEDGLTDENKAVLREILTAYVLGTDESVSFHDEQVIPKASETPQEIQMPKERPLPQFTFIHPENSKIITGKTVSRTEDGIIFKPDWPSELEGITCGTIITQCSLSIGGDFINPKTEVLFAGTEFEFAFI